MLVFVGRHPVPRQCQFRPEDNLVGGGTSSALQIQGPGAFGVGVWAGTVLVGAGRSQNGGGTKACVQLNSAHAVGYLSGRWRQVVTGCWRVRPGEWNGRILGGPASLPAFSQGV